MLEAERYRAPALDKGLEILELLAAVDGGLSQAEIAKQLGRSPNELYRMLDTLVRRGYVERTDGDRYALTLKMFGLAQLHAPTRRLVNFASPLMRELAAETRQANQLVVFDRGHAVVVSQKEAPGYWGISIRVGSHISLIDTGSGRILLAYAAAARRQGMVDENPETTGQKILPELSRRLDIVRDQGFETMASVQIVGVYNLSAPVLAADGSAIAALTIPYIGLVNTEGASPDMPTCISLLVRTCKELSHKAGAR